MNVDHGKLVGGLPNGHMNPNPVADAVSPAQGMDRNGPTAVIKSVSKLPKHRLAGAVHINLRISPQLLATDVATSTILYLLSGRIEELGIYHVQFNVISSDLLRKAMKEPENYRDLMVRSRAAFVFLLCLSPLKRNRWISSIVRAAPEACSKSPDLR